MIVEFVADEGNPYYRAEMKLNGQVVAIAEGYDRVNTMTHCIECYMNHLERLYLQHEQEFLEQYDRHQL